MPQAPAIEVVYNQFFALVAAAVPTQRPALKFVRVTDFIDMEELPIKAAWRLFDIDYEGGEDNSANLRGVQTPLVADRVVTLVLRVAYGVTQDGRDVELALASDVEILQRALQKAANWGNAPIRRVVPRALPPERDHQDGAIVIQPIELLVQYRDSE